MRESLTVDVQICCAVLCRDHLICMELWPSDKHRLAYTTSLLLFQYCLPLLLVLLCYLRIFLRLRRRRSHIFYLAHFGISPTHTLHCCITSELTDCLLWRRAGTCWSAAGGREEPRGLMSCC